MCKARHMVRDGMVTTTSLAFIIIPFSGLRNLKLIEDHTKGAPLVDFPGLAMIDSRIFDGDGRLYPRLGTGNTIFPP